MAMATGSMAKPPITSKILFPNKQVHSPKQFLSFVLCLLVGFSLSHYFSMFLKGTCYNQQWQWHWWYVHCGKKKFKNQVPSSCCH
jgi:hypothetical protein